jgi:hypothetical protein
VPISPALAEALGVAVDADDETVLAAVAVLRTPPPAVQPAETQTTQQEGGTETLAPAEIRELVNAAIAQATAPIVASAVEQATAPLLTQITELSGHVAASRQREADETKAQVIAAAVRDGKITPAQRDDWAARYDEAPQVVTQILASLAAGTAVPVAAAGHTGGEVTGGDADLDAMYAILYPEVSRG